MFMELWTESKATPRLFEIETFVTIDCLTIMFFPFGFCLSIIFLVL
jgi:hypothetical protein